MRGWKQGADITYILGNVMEKSQGEEKMIIHWGEKNPSFNCFHVYTQ